MEATHDVFIPHDFESLPLQLKTRTGVSEQDPAVSYIKFYTATEEYVTGEP